MKPTRPLTSEEQFLVKNNIALAKYLYQMYLSKFQKKADYGIDPDDLLSHAYYGLIRAAMRYRAYGEEKGYSEESIASGQYFSVFARKSIIGQMLDSLRKVDHVHTLVRKDYKILVSKGLGSSEKTNEDLARETDMPVERVQKVIRLVHSRPVYLDDSLGNAEQTVGSQLSDNHNVESTALETSLREALVEAMDALPETHKAVISLKYYLGMELPEIAEKMSMNLNLIRKIHTESLLLIHESLVSRVQAA
jgi:RNA polymerase sigma factor (sigma-70 family)